MLLRNHYLLAALFMLAFFCFSKPADAGIVVSIDVDSTLAGIQTSKTVAVGEQITASVYLEITGSPTIGLFGYGLGVRFAVNELAYVDRTDSVPVDLAVPANFVFDNTGNTANFNINTGNSDPSLGSGIYGELNNIGGTIQFSGGAFPPGPTSGTFLISTIHFDVLAGGTSGVVLVPVAVDPILDGFFDDSGNAITPVTLSPSSLTITAVPEPSTMGLLSIGLVSFAFRRLQSRRVLNAQGLDI